MYKLPALSVRQPWAWLICAGFKNVENRSRRTHYRGPLLIHAGLKVDDVGRQNKKLHGLTLPAELETGGIVGIVDVVDCVEEHRSPWFAGTGYGWVLAKPRRLRFREYKGAVGLFKLSASKTLISPEANKAAELKTPVSLDEYVFDEDGDLTEEVEDELPIQFDDEWDSEEERADGYPIDDSDNRVLCECSINPCIHNNPRPEEEDETDGTVMCEGSQFPCVHNDPRLELSKAQSRPKARHKA